MRLGNVEVTRNQAYPSPRCCVSFQCQYVVTEYMYYSFAEMVVSVHAF